MRKVALVAGGTRGAGRGIAVELGAAGATVYVTGRTTRSQASEYGRPETIEETAALVTELGGEGVAIRVDHLVPNEVEALVSRIRTERGRLDILVNDIWGGERLFEWNKPVWEHNLENGLRLLRLAVDTHLITAHHALPLMIAQPGGELARRHGQVAARRDLRVAAFCRTRRRRARGRPGASTLDGRIAFKRWVGEGLWLHRSRRIAAGLLALHPGGAGGRQTRGRDR